MSDDFSAWVGKREELCDLLEPARSRALTAALGRPQALAAGDDLPLLHHWLYFWDVRPPSGLGLDGHHAKVDNGFLPPVPLPRRMWAGGRLEFRAPLRLGETATRVSTIRKVETKVGKSGTLVFVTVQHEISGAAGLAVVEEQDLVYRAPAAGAVPGPVDNGETPAAPWHETVDPDPVLLFRYSALTMNGHRIHYDLPYAQGEEAYPALVVHGPLQATLLIDLAQRNLGAPVGTFAFRGQVPAFAGTRLHVCGEPGEGGAATVWTQQGATRNMVATVTAR